MFVLFLLMGIASFLYFAFLLSSASYLSALWIWFLFGILHLFLAFLYKRPSRWKRKSLFFRFKVFCLTSYCLFVLLIFSVSILLSRYKKGEEDKNLDYVLSLKACGKICGGEPDNPICFGRRKRAPQCQRGIQRNVSTTSLGGDIQRSSSNGVLL